MKHLAFFLWAAGCIAYLALIPAMNHRFVLDREKQTRLDANRAVLQEAKSVVMGECSWDGKTLPLSEAWEKLLERNRK